MGMTVPGGITGPPCGGGGAGSGVGIGICEFVGMTGGLDVIGPAAGGGGYCAPGMGIVGAINGGTIWLAAAPSDDAGY